MQLLHQLRQANKAGSLIFVMITIQDETQFEKRERPQGS